MKRSIGLFLLSLMLFFASASVVPAQTNSEKSRLVISFDKDWRFLKKDTVHAELPTYSDKDWRLLDVPHDWCMEDSLSRSNKSGSGGGYFPGRIGWYRKTFEIPANLSTKNIFIEFDGIMANSDVWINGFHLGKRPYGYVTFRYEMTGHLFFGKNKTNILAVRADDSAQPASRWYTGGGIYRHVRMIAESPVHVDKYGIQITTPEVSPSRAVVKVQSTLLNQSKKDSKIILRTILTDPDGKTAGSADQAQTIPAGNSITIEQEFTVTDPKLWKLEKTNLYKVTSQIISNKDVIDDETNTFGIRKIRFDAATGFYLNDSNFKIKGVCLHHDGGALGAAVPLRAWERRLEFLKQIGVNAIRTAHNPVAPEFLDLCDRMGFLVMDEFFDTWTARKSPANFGYHLFFREWWQTDTKDIVMRDRNHPSIVIYSVGNEIHDNLNNEEGFKKYSDLQNLVHSLDSTRPVTMALFRPNTSGVYKNGFVEMMDVVGQNYRENELIDAHLAKPERKVIGTENGHSLQAWLALRDNPFMSGQFLWSGIDYNGEAVWPFVVSGSGLLDRTGWFKPRAYQRQSWWSDKPMVRICRSVENSEILEKDGSDAVELVNRLTSDWTPRNISAYTSANVQVYSNCEEVELFLNGKSLGSQKCPADDSPLKWTFPFEPGTIKAVAKNNGTIVATHEMKTAGEPFGIRLTADKTQVKDNWDDVSYITATIVDKNGIECPNAAFPVTFEISGPGKIIAVDNGDRTSKEPVQAQERKTFNGECIAIIRANASSGKISVKASAPNLESGNLSVETEK